MFTSIYLGVPILLSMKEKRKDEEHGCNNSIQKGVAKKNHSMPLNLAPIETNSGRSLGSCAKQSLSKSTQNEVHTSNYFFV